MIVGAENTKLRIECLFRKDVLFIVNELSPEKLRHFQSIEFVDRRHRRTLKSPDRSIAFNAALSAQNFFSTSSASRRINHN
jgi:hypothetical protein